MARRPAPTLASISTAQPYARLGTVMRFTPGAAPEGVKRLHAGGFQIASSREFRTAAAVPHDFDGADVQYFERFGIAIIRRDGQRLKPVLESAMERKIVSSVRPEQQYRALGRRFVSAIENDGVGPDGGIDLDYLRGYRDGVNALVDRLLGETTVEGRKSAKEPFDETSATWGLQAIDVLHSKYSGAGIKIAVLDTGFDETHPDFQGRSVTKKLFASKSSPNDVEGHGTHCIGTACGPLRPHNGPRYGVAYGAEIYAGKVLGDDGYGTDRSIIAGMDWAVDQGCQVISMSLGAATRIGDLPNDDYEQIGKVCLDSGTLVVAAAGNESARPRKIAPVGSPANASTIMAVAAVDRDMKPAYFSCGGLNSGQDVDLAAPGTDVLSTVPGGGYERMDGTSMATPHVAGVAALVAESDPQYRGWALWGRVLQLTKRLNRPARDVGKGLAQAPK